MKSTTAVLAGWSARVVVVACSLVNTRLLLNMLDVPAYAVYAIVLSLGPWFNLVALGVPNTAQNAIARHRAEGTDHRRLQHTVVNTAAAAAALALVLCWPIGWVVQHTVLSGKDGMPTSAVALMCFGLRLTALTPVFNQVLFGLHRGLWPNVMPGLQSLATTALLLTMSSLGLNGIDWAVATLAGPALLVFVVLAKVAGAAPRHGIDWRQLKQVMVEGRHFLLFGLLSTGALSADYIVMARTLASPAIVDMQPGQQGIHGVAHHPCRRPVDILVQPCPICITEAIRNSCGAACDRSCSWASSWSCPLPCWWSRFRPMCSV